MMKTKTVEYPTSLGQVASRNLKYLRAGIVLGYCIGDYFRAKLFVGIYSAKTKKGKVRF